MLNMGNGYHLVNVTMAVLNLFLSVQTRIIVFLLMTLLILISKLCIVLATQNGARVHDTNTVLGCSSPADFKMTQW